MADQSLQDFLFKLGTDPGFRAQYDADPEGFVNADPLLTQEARDVIIAELQRREDEGDTNTDLDSLTEEPEDIP